MDPLFNMFKVKYSKLDDLLTKHTEGINRDTKVNLFINLEPVLKKLVAAKADEYLRVRTEEKSYELISNIINLIAHYRLFFTKNKLYSKIYMYINAPFKTVYKNRGINPKYRRYYEHRFTEDANNMVLSSSLTNALPFVKIILEYIEGVYLIESDSIESSVVPHMIAEASQPNTANFILSTDRYDYQYANQGFYIIRPKKDQSYIVNQKNLFDILKIEEKVATDLTLDPHFYPFVLSLLGDKYRNIDKIKGIGLASLLRLLNHAIDENIIGKNVTNINILSKVIKDEYRHLLLSNFYCVDIPTQFQMLNMKDHHMIKDQIVDKFDNVALKRINDDYFKMHPIMLLELTQANNLIRKKKNNIFL